jgi:catechol 2,3-dioxygenase-like lactoylglutathione lyase family enzyme
VRSLPEALAFYEVLLGAPPAKRRPGYGKFLPPGGSLNLSLVEDPGRPVAPEPSPHHFGLELATSQEVWRTAARLQAAGLSVRREAGTTCCHALQDKAWVTDPDGHRWEVFTVLADALRDDRDACCEPLGTAATEPASHETCCDPLDRETCCP